MDGQKIKLKEVQNRSSAQNVEDGIFGANISAVASGCG
jgi:hypothetical protein